MELEKLIFVSAGLTGPSWAAGDDGVGGGTEKSEGCGGIALLCVEWLALNSVAEEWGEGRPVKNIEVGARVGGAVVAPRRHLVKEVIADRNSSDGAWLEDQGKRKQ